MSDLTSTKPYMVRAMHEWCCDNGLTPHLLVKVNAATRVPLAFVKAGEIVLNLNYAATKDLQITNDAITFSARFGGVSQNLYVPINAVAGLFARENGQGMMFEADAQPVSTEVSALPADYTEQSQPEKKKPTLTIVK